MRCAAALTCPSLALHSRLQAQAPLRYERILAFSASFSILPFPTPLLSGTEKFVKMSYYNQGPPVGAPPPQFAPPPQGYPPQGYPQGGYPPQGYPQGGYPPQQYPQQYDNNQSKSPSFCEAFLAALCCCCLLDACF